MISYVLKYAGDHKKKTIFAMVLLTIGVLASMIPYLLTYQLIEPLLNRKSLTLQYVAVRIALLSVAALVLALIISFTERTCFCLGDMLWYSRGFLFGCQAFRESKDASLTRASNAYILYAPEG